MTVIVPSQINLEKSKENYERAVRRMMASIKKKPNLYTPVHVAVRTALYTGQYFNRG